MTFFLCDWEKEEMELAVQFLRFRLLMFETSFPLEFKPITRFVLERAKEEGPKPWPRKAFERFILYCSPLSDFRSE